MTSAVYRNRVVPRRRPSHAAHTQFGARQTCSAVASGFSPRRPAARPATNASVTQHDVRCRISAK